MEKIVSVAGKYIIGVGIGVAAVKVWQWWKAPKSQS